MALRFMKKLYIKANVMKNSVTNQEIAVPLTPNKGTNIKDNVKLIILPDTVT